MSQTMIVDGNRQPSFWLLQDHMTPLLSPAQTGGRLAVVKSAVHPGFGPPPHVHADEDEVFYILEGTMTFLRGDTLVSAGPGSLVWAPRQVVHCFQNRTDRPVQMLLIVAPTKFIEFAMEMAVPAADSDQVPDVTPEMIGKLMAVTPKYGIQMKPEHPMPTAMVTAAGPSKKLWVMGEHVSILATAEQTGGQFTIVEIDTAPGGGPPPHVHVKEDEIFYVLSGRHEVFFDDTSAVAGPGSLIHIPKGTRHRFTNLESTRGKLLSVHTPGGFESFYEECGVDSTVVSEPPIAMKPEPSTVASLLARHGMTV